MNYKFTIEDLMIRILPGGFFLAMTILILRQKLQLNLNSINDLDIFYTFLFFCVAFIAGELLQTLAHELEPIIDIFFKFRRPSQVFLYKNNPVLPGGQQRKELIKYLELSENQIKIVEQEYSTISAFKKKEEDDKLLQGIFWKLYHDVSEREEIKLSNRNYLFARVMIVEFLYISTLFFMNGYPHLGSMSAVVFLIFLWRSRGIARGLVFKTVLLNLNEK